MLAPLMTSVAVFTRTYDYLRIARRTGAQIESLKSRWALETLESLGMDVQVLGESRVQGPVILVGNHLSYLDVPLLMHAARDLSFVAKSEIQGWPVFGYGARAIGTTFVKRENGGSRSSAKTAIEEALNDGAKIVLFPAGTTCVSESKPWRHGAFEIAHRLKIPIQPFRIRYFPLRPAAYVGRDFFPVHLFRLAKLGRVTATLEFHPPVMVDDVKASCDFWNEWSKDGLEAETG